MSVNVPGHYDARKRGGRRAGRYESLFAQPPTTPPYINIVVYPLPRSVPNRGRLFSPLRAGEFLCVLGARSVGGKDNKGEFLAVAYRKRKREEIGVLYFWILRNWMSLMIV